MPLLHLDLSSKKWAELSEFKFEVTNEKIE